MNGKRVEGRVIEVEECKGVKEGRNGEKRVVRIEGWDAITGEDEVRRRCEAYGEVEHVLLESVAESGDITAAVVRFVTSGSAHRCIEDLHEVADGAGKGRTGCCVSVKFCDSKRRQGGRRRSVIAAGMMVGGGGGGRGGRGRGGRNLWSPAAVRDEAAMENGRQRSGDGLSRTISAAQRCETPKMASNEVETEQKEATE